MIVFSLLMAMTAPASIAQPVAHRPVRHVAHRRTVRHVAQRGRRIDARLHLAGCGYTATGHCPTAPSRYRLPLDQAPGATVKDDALAQNGTRCALIGQTICPSQPRTIVRVVQ